MQNARWNMQDKKVFISHSSKNVKFASWLSRLLICLGVDQDTIFYSSNFRQGVREIISDDVLQALKNTAIDIVILSNEYKSSEYCLNEAGIILFKNKLSDRIVITLPGIFGEKRAGFIDGNYMQFRLMEQTFFENLENKLRDRLIGHEIISNNAWRDHSCLEKLRSELEEFKSGLPVVDNMLIPYIDVGKRIDIDNERKSIKLAQKHINELHMHSDIFYKDYGRQIMISPTDVFGVIKVETYTACTVVNLSNEEYFESYSSQFLFENGGFDTFEDSFLIDNVKMETPERSSSKPMNSPYIYYQGPRICIPAHCSRKIESKSSYTIKIELFIQSKVLRIPCGRYSIMANFSDDFMLKYKGRYIFRDHFIPPVPRNLSCGVVPRDMMHESPNKQSVSYKCANGFPAGGGYVISLSKV